MQSRPISAIIFGILNVGYGAFNLFGLLIVQVIMTSIQQSPNSPFKRFFSDPDQLHMMWITGVISAVAGIFLLVAGVGLFFCKNWARLTSLGWAAFDILFVLISTPLSWKYSQAAAPQDMHFFAWVTTGMALVLSLAYPVAVVIFMRKPKFVAACQGKAANP